MCVPQFTQKSSILDMLFLVFYYYGQGFIVVAKSFMYPYFLKIQGIVGSKGKFLKNSF